MKKNRYTWKAFWIRNLKTYGPVIPATIVLWDIVEYGRIVHEYFGWAFEGYGPLQQRWYRILASGFFLALLFATFIDAISTWHYLKNPDEIPKGDDEDN